ncbi:hypothetical protein C1H46_041925 [Malus baccata]|uniref:Uncharacterized protein n=1 Tax=Malus baccata TaxID=106549 RepID=A0A540KE56_MALBA|nr:hypothetical protein C1H46_041925 [Malus baccata]
MIPLSIDYSSVTIHLSISGFNEVFPFFYADDDVHASFLYIDPENQVGLSHYQFIRIILIFRIFLYKLLGPNQSEAVVVLFTGDLCILDYFSFMFSAPIPTSWDKSSSAVFCFYDARTDDFCFIHSVINRWAKEFPHVALYEIIIDHLKEDDRINVMREYNINSQPRLNSVHRVFAPPTNSRLRVDSSTPLLIAPLTATSHHRHYYTSSVGIKAACDWAYKGANEGSVLEG